MNIIKAVLIAIAIIATTALSPSRAGENERQKIIIEMFEVMQYGRMIDQISAVVSQQITREVRKKAPQIPNDLLSRIDEIAREEFSKLKPELMQFVGVFMSKSFTEYDLKVMLEFYRSPTGKKSVSIMPQMMQEMTAWLPGVTGKFGQRVLVRVKNMMAEKGYQL